MGRRGTRRERHVERAMEGAHPELAGWAGWSSPVAAIYGELGEAALRMMERSMGADLLRAEEVEFG